MPLFHRCSNILRFENFVFEYKTSWLRFVPIAKDQRHPRKNNHDEIVWSQNLNETWKMSVRFDKQKTTCPMSKSTSILSFIYKAVHYNVMIRTLVTTSSKLWGINSLQKSMHIRFITFSFIKLNGLILGITSSFVNEMFQNAIFCYYPSTNHGMNHLRHWQLNFFLEKCSSPKSAYNRLLILMFWTTKQTKVVSFTKYSSCYADENETLYS
jgi:hypothetical protein